MHIINSISEFHRQLSLPAPLHPLVSVIDVSGIKPEESKIWEQFCVNFYSISLKKDVTAKVKYGQQYYDFDKGTMNFIAPKQIQSLTISEIRKMNIECGKGYMLMFHPDFLYTHPLAAKIKNYNFFSYALNEALHLSEQEEKDIVEIFLKIEKEYQHIDKHTQDIILSQIDMLLQYSNRFYERQFFTRKAVNNELLTQMEHLLEAYFDQEETLNKGLPTVEHLAESLNLSPRYLSDLLRSITGKNTQQHIHDKLIEKAKEKLAATTLSVSEIAYQLGFEHPQSFNKLFKKKTDVSPLAFRQSFN
ncbi:helix-turn-helix domain-containing protein [Sphingobacterium sp. UBA5670]|uniref:helix-turn-helix domain-containing protein n=1 Tax=Sphingobacterium sp. UBA5670 TaxID=1947502 RepID=UPI0025D54E37|nr:response regulator transcription factor [Sphingobacterium sp. UBA5670]